MLLISTSSSSAISIGRDVYVPCPISIMGEMIVTLPRRSMRMKAFGAKGCGSDAACMDEAQPITKPPPSAAPAWRKMRREMVCSGGCRIAAMFALTVLRLISQPGTSLPNG
jgi:hypothetical protein